MKNRVCALTVLALAVGASAQTVYDTSVTPTFFPGTGIPNANFVVHNNVPAEVQTGLTSFYRFGVRGPGDNALRDSLTLNTYSYRNGNAYTDGSATTIAPGTAAWNFSYHINLNTNTQQSNGQNFFNNLVLLTIDWDPTAGVDQRTYNMSALMQAGGAGSLSLLQDSQNPGFSFWNDPIFLAISGAAPRFFDPNATGTYRFQLDVIRGGTPVSSTEMFVNVTPTPGAAALFGLGTLAAFRRRR
ncbi:MAG TPA: hypothetical protein VEB22_05705 [Phycisphaerales bacterium]|nr:hypothetical protein [Phycisphaerales bacterium]